MQTIVHAAAARDTLAEDDFFAVVVNARFETKHALPLRLDDRPAGKTAGDFLNIFLRVAAVDAQRYAAPSARARSFRSSRGADCSARRAERRGESGLGAQPVVQVKQHRRAFGRGEQQVVKLA